MTTQALSNTTAQLTGTRLTTWLRDMPIGRKLSLGFGVLVVIAFVAAGVSFWGSYQATNDIRRTGDIRVPVALDASRAQADLLSMLSDVRGYLALGDRQYRTSYDQNRQEFEADLAALKAAAPDLDQQNRDRLTQLDETYTAWKALPPQLFDLRDDQLEREPAYKMLATDGATFAGTVLIKVSQLIDAQGSRDATPDQLAVLGDMARFQGSFAATFSALRGYVTTQNRVFRLEYASNRRDNDNHWDRLVKDRDLMTTAQKANLDDVAKNRDLFLVLPDKMFQILEGDQARLDLYRFRTEGETKAAKMQEQLSGLVGDQQTLMTTDLAAGQNELTNANYLILAGGFLALLFGIGLTVFSRRNIAAPISRLRQVAEKIRGGDLEAQARVESRDETGTLAETFNNMTGQLRRTLLQVRKEKKRADDLLEVVIPIGVELASEKDFNLLLEKMLVQAKTFCRAEAGTLYLKTEDNCLRYVIFRDDSLKMELGGTTGKEIPFPPLPLADSTGAPNTALLPARSALESTIVNIQNRSQLTDAEKTLTWAHTDEIPTSLLLVPLKNTQGQVLGLMQLIDARDESGNIVPFDANLEQMMDSFSDLAVAALEAYIREQSLRQQIQQLKIEIDEAKRQKEVSEIVDTDFFQGLQERAKSLRARRRGGPTPAEG